MASTTWFLNFLSMAGVKKGQIGGLLDLLPDKNTNHSENWEGEQGGMGIRALTRSIEYIQYFRALTRFIEYIQYIQYNRALTRFIEYIGTIQ